jgi:type IV pilus assembly protein PilX
MNMNTVLQTRSGKRQQGVVLVISLLMLLVLTLIGLAATRSTTFEERMTANQNDAAVAFQAAEAALRDGEGQMSNATQPNFAANASGAYVDSDVSLPSWSQTNTANFWHDTTQVKVYGGGITPTPAYAPSYYIVQTSILTNSVNTSLSTDVALSGTYTYYIYAHGYGVTNNTQVVLKSTYQD